MSALPARLLLATAVLLASALPRSAAAEAEGGAESARRLAAILDYVAADYAGAVRDGQVLSASEYAEQRSFVADAAALAKDLGGATPAAMDQVSALVEAKAAPAEVAAAARALRSRLISEFHVVVAPAQAPSFSRGAELFSTSCSGCHGTTGGGDGPVAQALNPHPRSFRDASVMEELSPVRAFNALTDGVKGTAMASFGALSDADRWNLAFYVFTLRHEPAAAARGEAAAKAAGLGSPALEALATDSDGAFLEKLGSGPQAMDALAWLRREAAYRREGGPFDVSRTALASAVGLYAAGKRAEAAGAAGAAYLDGYEPHEGALRARDEAFVATTEEAFLELRRSIENGAAKDEVEQKQLRIFALLDRSEEILKGDSGPGVAFAGALVIVLREGLEAALLVLMLLGMARKAGAGADARAVHAGWLLAVAAGLATWFASSFVVQLGGARREVMEGVVSLLAAAVLLLAGHWVLARADAKRRVDALKEKLKASASGGKRRAVLMTLGFVAVYREGFEVVLFLRAIALDHRHGSAPVALGALTGGVLLIGLVAALRRLGSRLKPGPLLTASGTLLCLLAFVLAGKGVHALQEAGWVAIRPLSLPRMEWLGIYPSLETIGAQLVVLAIFAVVAGASLRPKVKNVPAPVDPAAPRAG